MSEWLDALRLACQRGSQKACAGKMGYSPAVVNQVLKGTYKGDISAVEKAVRGALMNATVACPVAGEISAHHCLDIQKRPFAATNPQRVQLFHACKTCHHRKQGDHHGSTQ